MKLSALMWMRVCRGQRAAVQPLPYCPPTQGQKSLFSPICIFYCDAIGDLFVLGVEKTRRTMYYRSTVANQMFFMELL